MAKKENAATYNDQSIEKLEGAERVRQKPQVVFGSDDIEGCKHAFFEILSNSVDEAKEGYGDLIEVTVYKDNSIEVDDHGRGVPMGYNEKYGCYNWELVYCEMYAGAKYKNNDSASAYKYSLGLNGLGACATQYSSDFFEVYSYNGTEEAHMSFKKGEPVSELQIRTLDKKERRTGTLTYWRPDLEVFTDIVIPREYFEDILEQQAVINAGLRFKFKYENPDGTFFENEYFYSAGIVDYIGRRVGETAQTPVTLWKMSEVRGRDRDDREEYGLVAEMAFCMSNQVHFLEYYHNSSFLEHGGSPDKAVRTAFTYAVDKQIRTMGKYNKNEGKISFSDIEDCLAMVVNSASTVASYENQTKKAIRNSFIAEALTAFIKEQLEIYFAENPSDTDKLITQVLVNKRTREHVEKERLNIKKKLVAATDVSSRVEKFVSCRSKDPERRELYIVEGDSAMTSCKLGRDAEFQAIIPVRGKTLNCQKSSYDRIFKSDIIVDLLRVIGCGVEFKTKVKTDMPPFNINALRWSKIIICTDADEDGYQIRTLLLTLFNRLLPTLIKEGKVYIAESPLFEITAKSGIYFAYNEPEKAEILKNLGDEKYTIQRSKGLGENEPDMMWQTTMNPETRRLIRVTECEAEATEHIFDVLLGDNLAERKEYIAHFAAQYADRADI
ncbi:MAG: toprim domain-containing protein [Clostridia bacterium]|nr:toprim domain-containing protein [Clostridia bacterium]